MYPIRMIIVNPVRSVCLRTGQTLQDCVFRSICVLCGFATREIIIQVKQITFVIVNETTCSTRS